MSQISHRMCVAEVVTFPPQAGRRGSVSKMKLFEYQCL